MTDAAALAVINLTSKSVHSGYSSKEPVMIYYSLSCTRAFINALDVSHIFLFIFRAERGFLFHRHFSPKRILQHLRLHFFCSVCFTIYPFVSFEMKSLQLCPILAVFFQIAKRLYYYCLESCWYSSSTLGASFPAIYPKALPTTFIWSPPRLIRRPRKLKSPSRFNCTLMQCLISPFSLCTVQSQTRCGVLLWKQRQCWAYPT